MFKYWLLSLFQVLYHNYLWLLCYTFFFLHYATCEVIALNDFWCFRLFPDGGNPFLSLPSTQVGVTTTGAAHCPPTIRPCGPVAPAGTAWAAVGPAPPPRPPPARPSPPPPPGLSTATAWALWAGWSEGAFASGVPAPLRLLTATSPISTRTRKSLSSLPLSPLHNPSTLPTLCSRDILCPGGTAELCL